MYREPTRGGTLCGFDNHRLIQRLFVLGISEITQRVHTAQYVTLAQYRAGLVRDRVKTGGRLRDPSEQGGVSWRDLRQRLTQIGA